MDDDLTKHFKSLNTLNQFPVHKFFENMQSSKPEVVTFEDAKTSLLEWVAQGELLFEYDLKQSLEEGRVSQKLLFSYYKMLDAKMKLVELLKKDGKSKFDQIFAVPEARGEDAGV